MKRPLRWVFGRELDIRILELFQQHDRLSTAELIEHLRNSGVEISETSIRKRVSNMRVSGYLYYLRQKGNRLRMSLRGEGALAAIQQKREHDAKREEGKYAEGVPDQAKPRKCADEVQRKGHPRIRGTRLPQDGAVP